MKKLFSVLLFITVMMSARAQWPGPHSRIETDSIRSEALDAFRAYTVYLPADFERKKKKSTSLYIAKY